MGDQVTRSNAEIEQEKKEARFHEGKEHSHKAQDSKDERSIANKLEREEEREEKSLEDRQREQDATLPARAHGNEPSKGAKIDQELSKRKRLSSPERARSRPYLCLRIHVLGMYHA